MNADLACLVVPGLGYLVGSIPFGYLCSRLASGMDIRREGSGNIGATNIARVLGVKWGFLVLILDLLKGLLAVLLLPQLGPAESQPDLSVAAGFAAIIGHMYPVWLGFRGGKGVATALGVVSALNPTATVVAVTTFLFIVGTTRLVSLGSISAVTAFGLTHWGMVGSAALSPQYRSLSIFSVIAPLLIIIAHRQNIGRLLSGTESRLGSKSKPPETPPPTSP